MKVKSHVLPVSPPIDAFSVAYNEIVNVLIVGVMVCPPTICANPVGFAEMTDVYYVTMAKPGTAHASVVCSHLICWTLAAAERRLAQLRATEDRPQHDASG